MSENARIKIVIGDITTLDVDAIVNAANEGLAGGGGVDGAIHRAAGPELPMACRAIGHCPTGSAVMTPGFRLKARHIIHTVGPIWRGGGAGEADLLGGCYRNSLELARAHGFSEIAFPAISTGIYGYPMAEAAHVAITAIRGFLAHHDRPRVVTLCCFDEHAAGIYTRIIGEVGVSASDR